MSIKDIIASWAVWSKLSGNDDDDWVDRLNHICTVVILVIFALFVAGNAYVSDRIACWHPAELTVHQVSYANNYCWIKNTYYVPVDDEMPRDERIRKENEITYYQYVPLILLLMAFLFKVPNMIWRSFSSHSGIDLHKIVELTLYAHYIEDGKRNNKINDIAVYVDRWLEATRQYHWNTLVRVRQRLSNFCFFLNRREGRYLTGLYIIVKLLYSVNIICQFLMLDAFLGGFFSFWGIEAMYSLSHELAINASRRFPRITMCDYKVRQLSNVQLHTVQCVLPLNLFNEKIFLFVWFWFILVSIVTCSNFLFWMWRLCFQRSKVSVLKKYLKMKSRLHSDADKKVCRQFAAFLRDDGIFLIRMIQKNSTDILVADLVTRLWDIYLEKPLVRKMLASMNGDIGITNKGTTNANYI